MSRSIGRVRAAAEQAGLAIEVVRMGESTRTAEEAARQCGCRVEQIVKSLVFEGADSRRLYLFLVSGADQLDLGKAAALVGEGLKRADPRKVREETGFAIGGVSPLGHADGVACLADAKLRSFDVVWAAAGAHDAVFSAAPEPLLKAARATVAEIAAETVRVRSGGANTGERRRVAQNPSCVSTGCKRLFYRRLQRVAFMSVMFKRVALAVALLVFPGLAEAADEKVTFDVDGMKVVGTLNMPDGVENPPAILLLHGFTGSRDELEIPAVKEGIYARAARKWAEHGIASLRIDYRFNGESEGDFPDSTLDAHVADGLAALDYLAQTGRIDTARMALVGWSMGGAVGAAVAARTAHDLDAVALWAPGTNMAAAITLMFGAEKVKEALAAGDQPVELTMPWGAKIKLKSGFFRSLFTIDPVAEIARYDGPLFVAVGTKDDVVFPQPASGQILVDYHPGEEEELFVRPMDHVFNAFEGADQVDELIDATGAFIAKRFD